MLLYLQVPVHDTTIMQVFDTKQHFCHVEASQALREATLADKVVLEVAPRHHVHGQHNLLLVVECESEGINIVAGSSSVSHCVCVCLRVWVRSSYLSPVMKGESTLARTWRSVTTSRVARRTLMRRLSMHLHKTEELHEPSGGEEEGREHS